MNRVIVRDPIEGEGISAQHVRDGELYTRVLFPANFGDGARYLQDDFGNVTVLIKDAFGAENLYIVQSIDLDFLS